jgi:hypothetical protein
MLLFLPPHIQAGIGVVVVGIGLALGSLIIAGAGAAGLAVGVGRWVYTKRRASLDQMTAITREGPDQVLGQVPAAETGR